MKDHQVCLVKWLKSVLEYSWVPESDLEFKLQVKHICSCDMMRCMIINFLSSHSFMGADLIYIVYVRISVYFYVCTYVYCLCMSLCIFLCTYICIYIILGLCVNYVIVPYLGFMESFSSSSPPRNTCYSMLPFG